LAHVAPYVATPKPKPGKKATPVKETPTGRTKAQPAKAAARSGSKTAKILDLLRRPGGASAMELLKATGWQPHSLRGFLSGTVGKKMGLDLTSAKGEDDGRSARSKPESLSLRVLEVNRHRRAHSRVLRYSGK
jgi:hypothetical protein